MVEKKGDSKPIKFWPGLEDAIKEAAFANGDIGFSKMVCLLCDEALYYRHYKFPFHKPKFSTNGDEEEENGGR